MNEKTKHTCLMIALTIALTTLSACPPEEAGDQPVQAQPEVYDMEDYWPFELGNFWQFINTDGLSNGYQFTYEVLEDYSIKDLPAWSVVHKTYKPNGTLTYEATYYYVLRKDFLVFTEHKAAMIEMLQDPEGPIPTDLFVGVIAPRTVNEGPEPQQYDGPHYTLAGPLADLETYVDCGQPHDPVGYPEDHAIATLADGVCQGGDEPSVLTSRRIFVRGIGPVSVNSLKLVYAIVGNTEYNFES